MQILSKKISWKSSSIITQLVFVIEFYKYPSVSHLVWLGTSEPRDDKLLFPADSQHLLAAEVIVEEKLDGANLGISLDEKGELLTQNRGEYVHQPFVGQFAQLTNWLVQHEIQLKNVLTPDLILFGEWCVARHSLNYSALPDWFLLFDVYQRSQQAFWSVQRRNQLAAVSGLHTVPQVVSGCFSIEELKGLVNSQLSDCRFGQMEGIVIRRDSADWCEQHAKLVRADFVQNIDKHWSRRPLEWNRVDWEKNQRLLKSTR